MGEITDTYNHGKYIISVNDYKIKRSLGDIPDYKTQKYEDVRWRLETLSFHNISVVSKVTEENYYDGQVIDVLVNGDKVTEFQKYDLDTPIVIEYKHEESEKTTSETNSNETKNFSDYYAQMEAIINEINSKSGNQMVSYSIRQAEPGLTINLHTDSLIYNSHSELKIVLQSLNSKLVETASSVGFRNPPLYYTVDGVEVGNNRFIVNPLEIKYNDILD